VRHILVPLAVVCAALAWAVPLRAQDQPEKPEDSARYRFGPIRFTPTVEIRSIGVDTNVFNDASDAKRDVVASFGPAVDYWVRAGRSRLSAHSALQYDYFKRYATQRAFGTSNRARYEILLRRFTPFLDGAYDNTRRRPDFEIDARARYRTDSLAVGTDIRLLGRSTLRVETLRGHVDYDSGQQFQGSDLAKVLNRKDTTVRGSFRQALTPLTTFVVSAERRTYRFDVATVRDTDAVRVLPGLEIRPGALVYGRASIGYASFRTLDANLPDFHGLVANVEVSHVTRATRIGVTLVREPNYSYEVEEPYYVLTDSGVQVTQRITSAWDIVGRASRQWLDYRQLVTAALATRADRGWRAGCGTGWWVGQAMRLGFDMDYVTRDSPVLLRNYEGWRIGGTITYGSQNQ
jgi:hypothetical protein